MNITINRRMIVYKLFYLFSLAAMSIIPFLSLYFKQVGMSPVQIGILSSARPIFLASSVPIVGYLTDKYQAPRLTVLIGGCCWIGSIAIMGFVVMPFIEERSCDQIHTDLQWRSLRCGQVVSHSTISRHITPNTFSPGYEILAENNRSLDNQTDFDFCDSLESDRSWLYTPDSLRNVFIILLLCNCLFDMSFNPLHSIADAESVNTLQDMGIDIADYGTQRAFGSIGWALGPLIFGPWIAYTRQQVSKCGVVLTKANYIPMFIVFQIMAVGTMLTTSRFSYQYKQDSHGTYRLDGRIIGELCKLPNLTVLFVIFYIGACNGTLHGYLFWYLDDIGGDELIMGVASAIHGLSGLILGLSTGAAIRQFGHFPLMTVGILTYLIRFVYYAYVKQPWWILVAEVFNSLTFLLTWNTSLSYLSLVVPEDYRTSLASILNALYHGFGNAAGYVISGLLVEQFGSVATFQIFAAVSAAIGIIVISIFLFHSVLTKLVDVEKDKIRILFLKNCPQPVQYKPVYLQPNQKHNNNID